MLLNPFNRFFYLLAYLAVLFVRPHEFGDSPWSFPVVSGLLGVSLLLWLFLQDKRMEAPQFKLMPLILLMCVVSVVFAKAWFGGGWVAFTEFAPVVVLFYIVATSVTDFKRLYAVFTVMALSAAAICAHGVVQFLDGRAWSPAVPIQGRITYLGFLNDPNDLSMFLLMVLPLVLLLARRSGFLMTWVYRGIAAGMLYNVYLCNSRGSVLALGVMLLMWGVRRYGWWKSLVVVPIFLIPLVALAPSRMAEMDASEDSAEGRIEAWYEGFQMMRDRPLLGVGKSQFDDIHGLTAHNSYILAAAELGFIGYFFWLANLLFTWMMLRRIDALAPDPKDTSDAATHWSQLHAASRALWVGYVGGLVCAFFLSRSYVVGLYLHIALVVALYQMGRLARPNDLPAFKLSAYLGRLFIFAAISLFGLWLVTRILLAFTG